MTTGLLMFGLMMLMLLIGVPIGISLGVSTVIVMITTGQTNLFLMVQQRMFSAVNSFPLMAIPFFVLAGNLMEKGGISKRLVAFVKMLMRRQHAASASITTVASAFFGAISGSGPATTAAIGGIMIPSMTRDAGYKPEEAAAISAASGILGVIIPPSIPMVTYATMASVSVGTMFIAGFFPGILLVCVYILVHQLLYRNVEKPQTGSMALAEKFRIFKDAIFAIGMPVIILGGIYGGFFTPTEAAAVACVYSLLVGVFAYREINMNLFFDILKSSAKSTAAIMFIIAVASPFAWMMAKLNVPNMIAKGILSVFNSRILAFLMVNIFLLILGMFMDTISIIVLTTPILLPIAQTFGVDGITLGLIIVFNTAIGMITPPMAINFFVANSVAGLKSLVPISKKIWPYLAVAVAVLVIITYVPGSVTAVPRLFGMAV